MVAKATNDPHASPVKLKKSNSSKEVYEPWEMTERERELATKYIKLIQGRIPSKEPTIVLSDVSPGEDTITDMSASMISSLVSSSSQESVYNYNSRISTSPGTSALGDACTTELQVTLLCMPELKRPVDHAQFGINHDSDKGSDEKLLWFFLLFELFS